MRIRDDLNIVFDFRKLINDTKCFKTRLNFYMSFPKCGLSFFCIVKIEGDIKHLNSYVDFKINWNLDKFPNCEDKKMVDHILKIPRIVFFGVKCFNCDTAKLI